MILQISNTPLSFVTRPINKIYFKKSNIKKDKKRIIDRSARKNILKYGKFFFDRFNYSKNVPKYLKAKE